MLCEAPNFGLFTRPLNFINLILKLILKITDFYIITILCFFSIFTFKAKFVTLKNAKMYL